jgi:hypothetical protein
MTLVDPLLPLALLRSMSTVQSICGRSSLADVLTLTGAKQSLVLAQAPAEIAVQRDAAVVGTGLQLVSRTPS